MLELIVLITTVVLNLLLGLVVYIKNPQALSNRLFFMLTFVFACWSGANYVSVHPHVLSQLWWIRLVLACGALLNFTVFMTFLVFPSINLAEKYRKIARTTLMFTLIVFPLTLSPMVFKSLDVVDGKAQPKPAPGIAIFLLHTLLLIGGSLYLVIKKYRHASGLAKDQLRLVLFAIAGTFSLIVITNFLLVILFNFTALIPFGPSFTLVFTGALAYAIIRHRLFDIRAAIARAIAYVLSLGFIGLGYGLLAFGLTSFFTTNTVGVAQRSLYVVFALLTALLFKPTKEFFDQVTNRIFFQDAYDPQYFIDKLNKNFVTNIELEELLEKTNKIIEENIKAEYSTFLINKTSYDADRWIGHHKFNLSPERLTKIKELISITREKVVLADYLEEEFARLRQSLSENNIAVTARLVPTLRRNTPSIGYLVLGPKRSGNPYTFQDKRMLEIIANELVIAVENALRFEEIEKFNLTLQDKVNAATKELRQANEKLKALDETKDEFISMASHQLRTPLTSSKGYVSMVLEGDAGKITKTQKELLSQAFFSSQRMVYLIADLLNVSRLRTGKFVIENKPTQLADVIDSELEQLTETAKSRNLTLKYDKPKKFPVLMLDETKIRQVVMNFVDNAIYYTPSGGSITVTLADKPDSVELRVTDTGLGVPKADQHHLFTKFYRANNARKARPDGTGLGLFMAKKVVVAQGGAIIFESTEGKGSTFGFSFPKAKLVPKVPVKDVKSTSVAAV